MDKKIFVILNKQSVRGLLDNKKSIDNNCIIFNSDLYRLCDLEPIRDELEKIYEKFKLPKQDSVM